MRCAADHFHPKIARDPLRRRVLGPDQRDDARLAKRLEGVIAASLSPFGGETVTPVRLMNQVPDLALLGAVDRLPHEAGLKLLSTPGPPRELPASAAIRNVHAVADWQWFVA